MPWVNYYLLLNQIKMLKKLKLWWYKVRGKVELYPVHSEEITKILKKKTKGYIECTDNNYYTCDIKTLKKIVSLIPLKKIKYKSEIFDCDNYALHFYSLVRFLFPRLPIGYCHVNRKSGKHAANFIIYKKKSGFGFTFIEPQLNKVSYFAWESYLLIC